MFIVAISGYNYCFNGFYTASEMTCIVSSGALNSTHYYYDTYTLPEG